MDDYIRLTKCTKKIGFPKYGHKIEGMALGGLTPARQPGRTA